jgi:hypothetical protein
MGTAACRDRSAAARAGLLEDLTALRWGLPPHEALAQLIDGADASERFEGQVRVAQLTFRRANDRIGAPRLEVHPNSVRRVVAIFEEVSAPLKSARVQVGALTVGAQPAADEAGTRRPLPLRSMTSCAVPLGRAHACH